MNIRNSLFTTLVIILLLVPKTFLAQSTKGVLFYVDSLHNIANEQNYTYTRIVEDYDTIKKSYLFSEYYKTGIRSMKAMSKDRDKLIIDGLRIDYYENGNIKSQSTYKNNYFNGKQTQWYENGNKKIEQLIKWVYQTQSYEYQILQFWNKDNEQKIIDGTGEYEETTDTYSLKGSFQDKLKQGNWTGTDFRREIKYTETYDKGILISGVSIDKNNIEYYYTIDEEKPSPKKGMSDFYHYIGKNLKHPTEATRYGVSGKIYFSFYVDIDGALVEPEVSTGPDYGYKAEILRLINKAEKWIPGKIKGVPVKVKYRMPLTISRQNI